ncbi:MAG: UPF0755 protein [Nitrospinales bacterium]|jgi:UPF0755 protein
MRTTLISCFWGLLALVWIIVGLLYFQASRPMSDDTELQVFEVFPGMTLKKVSQELSSQNLIRSASAFQAIALIQDKQRLIMVGEYNVSPSMLPADILQRITSGNTVLHPVTIPEGYRITEIADLLEKQNLADKEVFLQQTKNMGLVTGVSADSLEGYLFPETYHFGKFTAEATIVKKMVETFKERALKQEFLNRARELGFSYHEIITLASLIEKETGKDSERKQISSVFHNRLKKNMRLQTDPTVIYAIEKFDGNIRKRDLKIDSPYNTYRHKGLPPGPIASPGLKSIVAALYPLKTVNLYFVSRQDGSHQFSATLNEHNRAVQKYQLRRVRH